MTIPLFTPARCVLLVSDEALCVYDVTHRRTLLIESVSWQMDGFEEHVADLIRKKCGGKQTLILNDMTDQHFKGGQKMPKVGSFDKASVVKRRLKVAFPTYPIRGALLFKEAKSPSLFGKRGGNKAAGKMAFNKGAGAETTDDMAGTYLFAAVPISDSLRKVMEAVKLSMASIKGVFLLPVEAADMVHAISMKAKKRSPKQPRWGVFIGEHKNGALRQVIVRDGQLAMTRMTPFEATGDDHDLWAKNVYREFKATVGYLSRFGFSPDDGVDVIVISHPDAGTALEKILDVQCRFLSYTTKQAAHTIGVRLGGQEHPYFADSLHAAWVGQKSRFILPMETGWLGGVQRARQGALGVVLLLLLGTAYFSWQSLAGAQMAFTMSSDLSDQKNILRQAEIEYNEELARLKSLGYDVNLIQGALNAYESFEGDRIEILPLVLDIQTAMSKELRLDSFKIQKSDTDKKNLLGHFSKETEEKGVAFDILLKFSFSSTMDPEVGVKEVESFKNRLKQQFPDYDITIERNLIGLDYSAEFSGSAGVSADQISGEDYVAEIKIRGRTQ